MNTEQREDSLTLEILQTIDNESNLTQRHLADRLGVALGLANSYLKRCVRKGLIKIEQAPANRYLYYLTPKGFAEKSRLTAEYLSVSFDFYRRASVSCSQMFQLCVSQQIERILLCGVSELAEIAFLRAKEYNLRVVGFWDSAGDRDGYLGLTVWNDFSAVPDPFDACIVTTLNNPEEITHHIISNCKKTRIYVPDILGITTGIKNNG